jgi:RimJ/RimL family protein N-acetyltransferase
VTLDLTAVDLPTEVVRTDRLVLRPFGLEDVDAVPRLPGPGDPALDQRHPRALHARGRSGLRRGRGDAAAGRNKRPVQRDRGRRRTGGHAGLSFGTGRLGPEIGYTVAPSARGRGYAAEAARGLAEWALGHGAPRVHLYADVRNTASQAVARRAGFTQEGVVRSCLDYRDGSRGDAVLFGRLPGD